MKKTFFYFILFNSFLLSEILPQQITVTSPNGGENWQAGTTHPITWTDNITENVSVVPNITKNITIVPNITEIENNLEDLYYEADVCEPFYNPYEQKWYHDDCPRALYVYAYHTVGNGAPKKQYFKGIKNCCNVDVYKIVLSTMVTFLFELLTHKSVVPIFRKFINYSSVMEKNIVNITNSLLHLSIKPMSSIRTNI